MATKKKNDEENALIKQESNAVASANIPEHLREFAQMGNVGFENVHSEDRIIPRLSIAQSTSDQRKKNNPLFISGLEEGDFFNTLTGEIYGPGPLLITPLTQFPSRIYFPERGSGASQLCATKILDTDGRLIEGQITPEGCDLCPHSKFVDNNRPDCTLFYNYGIALHRKDGGIEPVVFSAKSKMLKPAKKLNSLVHYRVPRLPGFTMIFEIATVPEVAPKGTFFNITVKNAAEKDVNAQQLAITKKLYEMMANRDIKIDMRGVESEEESEPAFVSDEY